MANITKIAVSTNQSEEQGLQACGFSKINVSLNKGAGGNPAYIWYKKQHGEPPITRVQVSSSEDMAKGLINAGYTKIFESLTPAQNIFLWYFSGTTSYDTPIIKLEVSTNATDEAEKMKLGWERAGCNLSGIYGWNSVYLWVKRAKPTYICDVTATNSSGSDEDLFQAGYVRIDQSTNTVLPSWIPPIWGMSSTNFLWYRQSTNDENAITDLKISTDNKQYQQYQQQNYTPVSVNLNEGVAGNPVYLWYKKMKGQPPVESMILLFDKSALKTMERNGIIVNQENINISNNEAPRYLCVKTKQ